MCSKCKVRLLSYSLRLQVYLVAFFSETFSVFVFFFLTQNKGGLCKSSNRILHGSQNLITVYKRLHTDLFAIRGHQVEATGGDI